ncbi:hypothetical protein DYB37_003857 [Aphanomyces astaci]|uniref:Uncharacterized protein n=1 Tax=Aphanomyces astaci TaxID=112090 RepID=A0A418ER28_APHAT|nr:hypothetical protein DYB37_003857 [Aphanomyces astaci]
MKQDAMCVVPPEFKTERAKIDSDDRLGHKRALRKLKKKDDVIERKPSVEGTVEMLVAADEDKGSSSDSSSESDDDVVNSDSNGDNKHPFVLEIDDETDEDLMSVLLEQPLPEGVSICNTDSLPGTTQHGANIHLFLSMKRVEWDEEHTRDTRVNVLFSHVFKMLFTRRSTSLEPDDADAADDDGEPSDHSSLRLQILQNASSFRPPQSPSADIAAFIGPHAREWIELTPLSYVPGAKILRYLGRITLHFIKESWTVRECGGLGAFFHLFLSEAISVVRAHVRALGGNAMLSFRLVPIESSQLYRNQVYNMISVTGMEGAPIRYHTSIDNVICQQYIMHEFGEYTANSVSTTFIKSARQAVDAQTPPIDFGDLEALSFAEPTASEKQRNQMDVMVIVGTVTATTARVIYEPLVNDESSITLSLILHKGPRTNDVVVKTLTHLQYQSFPYAAAFDTLVPNSTYFVHVQVGTTPSPTYVAVARFRTPPLNISNDKLVVLALSCDRFLDDADDSHWATLAEEVRDPAYYGTVHTGDQIYADSLEVSFRRAANFDATLHAYRGLYRRAFGRPLAQRVLRHGAHYMQVDDHDIVSNWSGDTWYSHHAMMRAGLQAYFEYQYQLLTDWTNVPPCQSGPKEELYRTVYHHVTLGDHQLQLVFADTRFERGLTVPRSLWNGSSWLVLLVLVVLGGVDADVVACTGTMCSCSGAFACSYDTTASVCQCTFPQAITIGLVAAVFVFGAVWYVRAYKMRKRKDTLRKAKSTAKMVQISQTGRQAQQEINPASKWHMAGPPPQNFNSIAPQ